MPARVTGGRPIADRHASCMPGVGTRCDRSLAASLPIRKRTERTVAALWRTSPSHEIANEEVLPTPNAARAHLVSLSVGRHSLTCRFRACLVGSQPEVVVDLDDKRNQ